MTIGEWVELATDVDGAAIQGCSLADGVQIMVGVSLDGHAVLLSKEQMEHCIKWMTKEVARLAADNPTSQ